MSKTIIYSVVFAVSFVLLVMTGTFFFLEECDSGPSFQAAFCYKTHNGIPLMQRGDLWREKVVEENDTFIKINLVSLEDRSIKNSYYIFIKPIKLVGCEAGKYSF